MAISINPYLSPRIITVLGATSITIQNLVNQIMDWEDEPWALTFERIIQPSGKQDLGGGTLVGITARLLNAKVRFEDQGVPTICTISGGNLAAIDAFGASMSPIEPCGNCTVILAQSSSATMIQDADIDAIKLKTDNLPASPASEVTLVDVHDTVDVVDTEVTGIKGVGWTDETLKKLKELIETVSGGGTNFKV